MTEKSKKWLFLSGETYSELSPRLKAEPVATGEGALVSEEAIRGDWYVSNQCLKCGLRGALFVFEQRYVSLCPQCATERIEQMAADGRQLPPSVLLLHRETTRETTFQKQLAKEALSTKLEEFFRCHRCGAVVHEDDAGYWFPPGEDSSPSFCRACLETLASRQDELRDDRPGRTTSVPRRTDEKQGHEEA
jgi:hypothetical protein